MDLESIDEIFSDTPENVLALVSGIAIIITVIFFIYAVIPHSGIILFSFLSLLICFSAPIFFRLSDMTIIPDVVGWLLTGVAIAGYGWIIFHVGYYVDVLSLKFVIPSGLLGFASGQPLTRGVLIPLFGGGGYGTVGSDVEIEEEEEFEEGEEDLEEFDEFEEESEDEYGEEEFEHELDVDEELNEDFTESDEIEKEEDFSEEKDKAW
ncbi:MAG: hypothetical protein KGY76_04620 [Candidatus Thermoplasmatota archaeon]|nr:hypothetical protein [Candidatus Thermoplasmatota archaeon]